MKQLHKAWQCFDKWIFMFESGTILWDNFPG